MNHVYQGFNGRSIGNGRLSCERYDENTNSRPHNSSSTEKMHTCTKVQQIKSSFKRLDQIWREKLAMPAS